MATNKRHFEWFSCSVEVTCCLAGKTSTSYSFFDFYCSFPLSSIQSFVKIDSYLPNRFCSVKLSFRMIDPVLSPGFINPLYHMRSYEAIKQMVIRNIIYTLTIDKLIYEFQVDKTL